MSVKLVATTMNFKEQPSNEQNTSKKVVLKQMWKICGQFGKQPKVPVLLSIKCGKG